jgi:lysophospholipase L1-like esterase
MNIPHSIYTPDNPNCGQNSSHSRNLIKCKSPWHSINALSKLLLAGMVALISSAFLQADSLRTLDELAQDNIHFRGQLSNSRIRFEQEKQGLVAFIGGSITEMNGYRPMVAKYLSERFSATKFSFINAGISSTCSTTGAFRLHSDVLSKGLIDLFFIEFAVNDDQDAGHSRSECIRGMEGLIRQARRHNPKIDIVITYFVNPGMLADIKAGKIPTPIAGHEQVAQHYQIPSVNLAKQVCEDIQSGELTWEKFGGVHPSPYGNSICAQMIAKLLDFAWRENLGLGAKMESHCPPARPLDENSYSQGRFISPQEARFDSNWELFIPNWKALPGHCRSRFVETALLCSNDPGAELTLQFSGRTVGAYLLAGPDAGMLEVNVDGIDLHTIDLYHRYSKGLHYPRTVIFQSGLKPGRHLLRLKLSNQHNPHSAGTALRLIQFTAN